MSNNNSRGWVVVFAGLGINLMFGALYAWSIFAANLIEIYKWTSIQASLPYTIAILMFAVMMLLGGKLQDTFGPRLAATISGVFVGLGLIMSSIFPSLIGVTVSFGIITGSGIGIGYSATTPAAVKWFEPHKKGLITGIVVTGFGLASLYVAPLTKYLISSYGLFNTFKILGAAFGLIIIILAQLLTIPKSSSLPNSTIVQSIDTNTNTLDYTWQEMIKTPQFYILWVMFFAGALAGLMLIGHLAKIAILQTKVNLGVTLVATTAISNALGRPIAGFVSDKIGRGKTMMILYLIQGITLVFFSRFSSFSTILIGSMIITCSYGAMMAVYPSAIGDYYGTKNLGFNYAILFTAWGIGGLLGPILAGYILDKTGGYHTAFIISAILCLSAALLGWFVKPPSDKKQY